MVKRYGKSLTVLIPSKIVDLLGLRRGTKLYYDVVGNKIVYSLMKLANVDETQFVIARYLARSGKRICLGLTIPAEAAAKLHISEGHKILIYTDGSNIYVEKLPLRRS